MEEHYGGFHTVFDNYCFSLVLIRRGEPISCLRRNLP